MNNNKKAKLFLSVVPEAWSVLYVSPMVDEYKSQGRKCSNCFMWAMDEQKCAIHHNSIKISGDFVCGYHVTGQPLNSLVDFNNYDSIQHVDPKLSGLEHNTPKEGTMCGNCKFYSPSKKQKNKGRCNVVTANNDSLPLLKQSVDFYGCCTRWEGK